MSRSILEFENALVNTPSPEQRPAAPAKTLRISDADVWSSALLQPYSEFGEYMILAHLGTGGMGIVYGARHMELNRRVALKVMRAGPLATSDETERFRREAEAAAKLNHPNIVPIFEIGQHNGCAFFSMQYVEGETLSDINITAKDRGAEWIRRCAGIIAKVGRAVQHAHEHLVLHRDLKPANILIDERGEPHVTDFGLAKLLENGEQHTLTETVLGTPEYMSPEQATGQSRDITTAADIFSLGAVLYHLLTGVYAFKGKTVFETIDQVRQKTPVPLREINPHVPRDLEVICLKCLEKEPTRRYSAAALADELERWLNGRPILARPASMAERTWKWVRRNPTLASALGAAAVILVVGVAGITWQWRRAERQRFQTQQANARLEVQRAEDYFTGENSSVALATLARVLRDNPANRVAAARLINALNYRQFLVPITTPAGAGVTAASFTTDGALLVTGTNALGSVVTLLRGNSPPLHFSHGARQILAARLASDGRWLASGSENGMRIWNARAGSLVSHSLTNKTVHFVAFVPMEQGEVVAAVTTDAVILSPMDGSVAAREILAGHTDVMLAAQSADRRTLGLATESGHVLVRDLTRDREWLVINKAHTNVIRALAFSTDRRLVSASADGTARVWDLRTGKQDFALPSEETVLSAEFRRDNLLLATAGRDGVAQLWDALVGQPAGSAMKHPAPVNAARFSPDGRFVITACDDGITRLWATIDARLLAQSIPGQRQLTDVAFSPDGQSILSVADGGNVMVYARLGGASAQSMRSDIASMRSFATRATEPPPDEIKIFAAGHADEVIFMDVSPDGALAATASADRTARVWKRATRQPLFDPLLHDAPVNCARFSADGALLVTSTASRKVRVWDAQTGQPITDWIRSRDPVSQVWLSPNAGHVITDQREVWPLYSSRGPVPAWLSEFAEAVAGVRLSERRVMGPAPSKAFAALRERLEQNAETNGLSAWAKKLIYELPAQNP